jgi:hypothetical protein
MKRIIAEILFVWALFAALMFLLANLARGQTPTPPTVTPSYAVIGVSATSQTLSGALPPSVGVVFQPYSVVLVNGQTVTLPVGPSILVNWSTTSTTSTVAAVDVNGNPVVLTYAGAANAIASISAQQLIATLAAQTASVSHP